MDTNGPVEAEKEAPSREVPLQFSLNTLLAAALWLAIVFAVAGWFGFAVAILFLLVSGLAIGIWLRLPRWGWACIAMSLFLLLMLYPGSDRPPASRRMMCSNNLKQITLALFNYHSDYGCFPPAYVTDENGRPIHSWRVLILPYLEHGMLYEEYNFSEPWNGPNNSKLAQVKLYNFSCPEEPEESCTTTNYLAVVGPRTAWPGAQSTKFRDFLDGSSRSILVVEVADSGIHWMEPRDLHVVQMAPGVNPPAGQGICSNHPGGAHVLMADGSVRFLPEDLLQETLEAALRIDDGSGLPEESPPLQ